MRIDATAWVIFTVKNFPSDLVVVRLDDGSILPPLIALGES